jgi:DnaJ like chaperone protein
MRHAGKLIGGVLGLFTGGPVGAAIGVLVGHQFDAPRRALLPPDASFDALFFRTTFEVMGHVAKSDGRVSEREIAAARAIMSALRLDERTVAAAITCFQWGKSAGYPFEAQLERLRAACEGRADLARIFFEIQMRAALEGADLAGPARARLQRIGAVLGVSRLEFAHVEAALRLRGVRAAPEALDDAYAVLEVAPTATDEEVEKAYRRQLSRHHPDKLKANGLPESMLEHAKQRTQQIIEAWDRVRTRRGIR